MVVHTTMVLEYHGSTHYHGTMVAMAIWASHTHTHTLEEYHRARGARPRPTTAAMETSNPVSNVYMVVCYRYGPYTAGMVYMGWDLQN
jgi:hypothetical protein